MPTDAPALLAQVAEVLRGREVPFALAGAAALAVRGVSRSTQDIDLLVVDPRVLAPAFWSGLPRSADVDIRTGDADDPLAGVVRVRAGTSRDVDVVVGRGAWQEAAIGRADRLTYGSVSLPVIGAADLVLLKLHAGGAQDRWDIEQLVAQPGRDILVADVERRLGELPAAARRLWDAWRPNRED